MTEGGRSLGGRAVATACSMGSQAGAMAPRKYSILPSNTKRLDRSQGIGGG